MNLVPFLFGCSENVSELLLHRAVRDRAVVQHVIVLVVVAIAAGDMHIAGIAILGEAAAAGAAVVVRGAAREGVGIMIAGSAHLEPVAVALRERAIVVGLAPGDGDGGTCLPEVIAVIGILMRIAIDELVPRARSEFAGEPIGVLALIGGVHVVFALAILNRVVRCARGLNLDAGILVAGGNAGVDNATGFSVDVNARMIHAGDRDAVEPDVIAGDESVAGVVEVERGRAGNRYA